MRGKAALRGCVKEENRETSRDYVHPHAPPAPPPPRWRVRERHTRYIRHALQRTAELKDAQTVGTWLRTVAAWASTSGGISPASRSNSSTRCISGTTPNLRRAPSSRVGGCPAAGWVGAQQQGGWVPSSRVGGRPAAGWVGAQQQGGSAHGSRVGARQQGGRTAAGWAHGGRVNRDGYTMVYPLPWPGAGAAAARRAGQ